MRKVELEVEVGVPGGRVKGHCDAYTHERVYNNMQGLVWGASLSSRIAHTTLIVYTWCLQVVHEDRIVLYSPSVRLLLGRCSFTAELSLADLISGLSLLICCGLAFISFVDTC